MDLPGEAFDLVGRIVEREQERFSRKKGAENIKRSAEIRDPDLDSSVQNPVRRPAEGFQALKPRSVPVEGKMNVFRIGAFPAPRSEPDRVHAVVPFAAEHCCQHAGSEIQPEGRIGAFRIGKCGKPGFLLFENLFRGRGEVVHGKIALRGERRSSFRRLDADVEERGVRFSVPPGVPEGGTAVPVESVGSCHSAASPVFSYCTRRRENPLSAY